MMTRSLYKNALYLFDKGESLVWVTVMGRTGSTPRTAGACMVVNQDGRIWGTVGGGRCEAEAITLAKWLLRQCAATGEKACSGSRPGAVMEFSLRGVTDMDMICGGSLSLLMELWPADAASRKMFSAALEAETKLLPYVFISEITRRDTELPTGPKTISESDIPIEAGTAFAVQVIRFLYLPGKKIWEPFATELPESIFSPGGVLKSTVPHRYAENGRSYLVERFDRPFRVILFGGGHVALEVAALAHRVGFLVAVLDDRAEFANPKRFPQAQVIVPSSLNETVVADFLGELATGPHDGIVIVTRGHAHDRDVLAAALGTPAGYIGMIGSKTKRGAIYQSMRDRGFSRDRIDRVHSPIGLSIGADTPQEIAVSIVAQLIQWRQTARDATNNGKK